MELTGFIPLLRRWWWLLVAATIVAGGAAHLIASRLPPTYEADVRLLTGPINTDFGTLRASGELARTYSELATSRPLVEATAEELGLRLTIEDLGEMVQATANEVTRVVTIRVRHADAGVAAEFANDLAARLTRLTTRVPEQQTEAIDELMRQREIASLPTASQERVRAAATRTFGQPYAGRLQIVEPAIRPAEPVAPRVSLITVLAALAGLLVAGIFVVVRESWSDAVDSEDALVEVTRTPLLGSIDGFRRRRGLVVEDKPDSIAADAYRLLAAKIGFSESARPVRTLLVVGSADAGGTGMVAANLAAVLAESDVHVTLVDANSVGAEITKALGLDDRPGYAELLERAESPDVSDEEFERLRVRRNDNLDVVPVGTANGRALLMPDNAQRLLDALLARSDLVVLNAPSVERSPSTLVWARVADATTLVVHHGRTPRDDVAHAVETLRHVGANLIGTIVRQDSRLLSLR